jgi:sRNA-binding regulator protein Hfq
MPREVFAEEIERFLGTLDGVASARVFTTPAGEIAQVYVTAERMADPRGVRRSITTALLSTYGLSVDPWRVQVTQFRGGIRPSEIPRFRLVRVDERVSKTEIVAAVQIGWVHLGDEKVATGHARGPSSPRSRLRTLATATLEAIRDALPPAHRRLSVQQAGVVTFLDQTVALVGISVPAPRGSALCLGTALQEELPELVVSATLDAVTKWLLRAAAASEAPQPLTRREQLESMRHFVLASERGGVVPLPAGPAGGVSDEKTPAGTPDPPVDVPELLLPDAGGGSLAHLVPEPPAGFDAHSAAVSDTGAAEKPTQASAPVTDMLQDDPDVLSDLSQIRPVKKGGTEMSVHQEPSRGGVVPPRGRTTTMEETFYQSLIDSRTPVHLRCRDGYELPRAVVKDVSTYAVLVETSKGSELIFKHAIISIHVLPAQVPEA